MHQKSYRNMVRRDIHIKKEKNQKPLTCLEYGQQLPNLLQTRSKKELAEFLGISVKELGRLINMYKVPTEQQCEKIRRLLNEDY